MLRRRGDNAGLNSSRDKFVNPITRPIIILIHLSVCVCVCVSFDDLHVFALKSYARW